MIHVMLCYAIMIHVMLCYAMLCYHDTCDTALVVQTH